LVGLRGQRWKEVRRVISPTFSARKMRKINSTINRCVDILVEVVDNHAENQSDIDFYGVFQGLTCQVITLKHSISDKSFNF
jgi:cytochrome P450